MVSDGRPKQKPRVHRNAPREARKLAFGQLRPQEVEIVAALARGRGVAGAAEDLGLTVARVDEAVLNARHRSNSGSTAALVVFALRKGMVEPWIQRGELRVRPTARQYLVLHRLAQGMDDAEAGASLGMTPNAVRKHVSRMLTEFGVADRNQLIAVAWQLGLVHV